MQPVGPERGQGPAGGMSRAVKAVLALAAAIVTVTGAIAGVRGLLHHDEIAVGAHVSNLSVIGPASLRTFELRERVVAGAHIGGQRIVLAQATVSPTATPEETTTATPTGTPGTSPTATPAGSASPTATGTGDITVLCDPNAPAGGTADCPARSEVDVCLPDAPPDDPVHCPDSVAGEQKAALDGPLETTPTLLQHSLNMGEVCGHDALAGGCALSDAGAPPQTAAARRQAYERIIRGIRSTRTRRGPAGRATPLGMIVGFEVVLRGLAGHDVDVTWTVFAKGAHAHLGSDWFADRRAIRWHLESNRVHHSPSIWVPLPPRRGHYFAQLSVRDESGGDRLTFKPTRVFR
jgi:hypothetical protein